MEWGKHSLRYVAEINPRRPSIDVDSKTPVTFVPMQAVSEVTAAIHGGYDRPYGEVSRGFTYFENNDVLFAKITPCMENGKSALVRDLTNGIGFGSTEFHVLRAKAGLLPEYLHYFICQQSFRNAARSTMRGAAGQQRVPKSFLEESFIPLPPPAEQRRIVEILDQADASRKKRAEADKIAARILPALFYKMFGDPATNPMGWDVGTVSDYCRQDKKGVNEANGEGLPYLGLEHVEEESGRILVAASDAKQIDVRGNAFLFSDDHVLYGKLRPYLNKVALPNFTGRCSTELVPLLPQPDYPREFIAAFLRLPHVVSSAMATNKGARMPRADMKLLMNMPAIKPEKRLRYEFADRYRKMDRNYENRLNSVKQLDSLFAVLLHRAFTGDLTANWRKAHMKELLKEREQQAKELGCRQD